MVESLGKIPPFQLKCWNCGGENHVRDFPNKRKNQEVILYNLQEVFIVGDVCGNITRLCAALINQQAEHQTTRIEVEGRSRLENPRTIILCIGQNDQDCQG